MDMTLFREDGMLVHELCTNALLIDKTGPAVFADIGNQNIN